MTETLEKPVDERTLAEQEATHYAEMFNAVGRTASVTVYRHEPIVDPHGVLLDLGRIHAVMTVLSTEKRDDTLTMSWITTYGGKRQTTRRLMAQFGDVLGDMRELRTEREVIEVVIQLLRG